MMKCKLLRAAAATVAAVLALSVAAHAMPSVSAESAILVEAGTGRVLYEKNADAKSLIASTTKIMTGLLVAEEPDLERLVQIPPEAVGVEGSSLYLREGEELTLMQLLYGLMLRSGNDAAVALAIATSGSVERFVARMNTRAEELGLKNTHFVNPNGLDGEDGGNYATARELAVITRAAMENPILREVVATKHYTFGERSVANHNKLLWRYEGAIGVKTGYTKAAGRLLVSAAERGGMTLIAVTIHAPNDWNDHTKMLDYGFEICKPTCLMESGASVGAVRVVCGDALLAQPKLEGDLYYPLLDGEAAELRICLPKFSYAPLQEGDAAGCVQALIDGRVVAQRPLVFSETIEPLPVKKNFFERLFGDS